MSQETLVILFQNLTLHQVTLRLRLSCLRSVWKKKKECPPQHRTMTTGLALARVIVSPKGLWHHQCPL